MFGVNDNTQASNDDPAMLDNVKQLASQPADQVEPPQMASAGAPDPAAASTPTTDPPTGSAAGDLDNPAHLEVAEGFTNNPIPDSPVSDGNGSAAAAPVSDQAFAGMTSDSPADSPANDAPVADTPAIDDTNPPAIQSTSTPADVSSPDPVVADGDAQTEEPTGLLAVDHGKLASLKQEALGHLEPLTEHIDGTPTEVFRTTMQLIQANDNHTLLERALEAAKQIEDDRERAQALLDIINEINYFAQGSQDE